MTSDLTLEELLNAGAHYGHLTRKWNPKMRPFIYGIHSGVHIINLDVTMEYAERAFAAAAKIVSGGDEILFVGTKQQAQQVVEEAARKSSMPFVTRRWLGGLLTNFVTIRRRVEKLIELETKREKNDFAGFTKKELLGVDRQIQKLEHALGGIKLMRRIPGGIFVVDPTYEHIAIHEAKVLGIPVIAITDTNCDPDPIAYPIPANDDSVRSIQAFVSRITEACVAGLARREELAREEPQEKGGERRPLRRAQDLDAPGKAYVTRVDTFETGEGVDSYSATVSEEEPPSAVVEEEKVDPEKI